MPQLRLTVQTITPLLMYGANNKDDRTNASLRAEPELRASSIRGILRYWLRAVLGAQTPSPSLLFAEESKILGSTAVGSKVQVRVQPSRSLQKAGSQTVLPAQTKGYSLSHTGFTPGSEFRIVLATHPLYSGSILDANSDLLKAIFLMVHLGGLGRRARRGSGNLRVLEAKGYEGAPELAVTSDNRDALAHYLAQVAQYVTPETRVIGYRPTFPIFAGDTAVVLLGQETHSSYDRAFKELWNVSGPYHHAGGIFGDVRPRRASAIHMRVAATAAGYVAQQTILYSGNGEWAKMKDYIESCQRNGFEAIYGTWKHWA